LINPLIIISDAHVSEKNKNLDEFFRMLSALSKMNGDIIFLGDIFDLWVGLKPYQMSYHRDFLAWCKAEKNNRMVGFIEGNHEFFISRNYADSFSWCEERGRNHQGILFVHGDLINIEDKNYLKFRKLTKNRWSEICVRWLPFGPSLVDRLKKRLKSTNQAYRMKFPEKCVIEFIEQACRSSETGRDQAACNGVIFGHFHHEKYWSAPGGENILSMPAWLDKGDIGLVRPGSESFEAEIVHWQSL